VLKKEFFSDKKLLNTFLETLSLTRKIYANVMTVAIPFMEVASSDNIALTTNISTSDNKQGSEPRG
jgi:hypothetical protein